MDTIKIKISLSNSLYVLRFHLIGTILMIVFLLLYTSDYSLIFICGIFWIIVTVPVLLLHVDYYIKNRNQVIEISSENIKVKIGERVQIFEMTDIDKIIIYKSASLDKGGFPIMAMESYNFIRIIFKSKVNIVITCLMYKRPFNLIQRFPNIKFERKRSSFCFTSMY